MMKREIRPFMVVVAALALLFVVLPAGAQDDGGEAPAPADEAPAAAPPAAPQLLNRNLELVNGDICRLLEEMRRTDDRAAKRELVKQVEYLLYKHVEFPLVFKQADAADAADLERIGSVSDVTDAGAATPLAPQVAEAFALYGIAKGYEGFAAAANDNLERAKQIYPTVGGLTVKIDNFQDRRPIEAWLTEAQGRWAGTSAVRVTFHGKTVAQESVDTLNEENVSFAAAEGAGDAYALEAARDDFLRGLRRYIVTDERLTGTRPNEFAVYLPPGKYVVKTTVSTEIPNELVVSADPADNHFMIESIEQTVTVYPRPKVTDEKKPE